MTLLSVAVAAAVPIALYDLESNDGGFIESGETGQWAWGAVTNGPGSSYDGANAWSTGLTRNYLNETTDYVEVPVPDLSTADRPMFSFRHWYDIAVGDNAWVEIDSGNGWAVATPLYGYPFTSGWSGASGGWQVAVFDLSDEGAAPRVRLAFATDTTGVAAGWTVDNVAFHDGDVAPPQITDLIALADTDDLEGPYAVEVSAEDDVGVAGVTLWWTVDGVSESAAMSPTGDGVWEGEIPAQLPDTQVSYWVAATDGLNETREPEYTDDTFRVYLPAPTDLVAPSGRLVATEVTLSWSPPDSRNAVLGYEIVSGESSWDVTETTATVPVTGGEQGFLVRALYEAGPGDFSNEALVDAVVPAVHALEPAVAYAGDTLRVRLEGDYLLLVDGAVAVDLGADVTVAGVDVRSVDEAWLDLVVGEDAAPGLRTLTVESGDTTLRAEGAFTVLPASDRPRLTEVKPDTVRQGDSGDLSLTFTGSFSELPTVDLGEGLVASAVSVDGDQLVVHYVVTAQAPLGAHAVTVDDGVRILSGVDLEVKDAYAPPADTCGVPVPPTFALVAAGVFLVRRRRA